MRNKAIINFSGGVIPTKLLRLLATIIYRSNCQGAYLSSRQQFIIPKIKFNDIYLNSLRQNVTVTSSFEDIPNIVCSNNAGEVFSQNDWAYRQDIYIEILRSFKTEPKLSLGLIFPKQSLEPIFSSHINFIVSETENYWLLVLQNNLELTYASFLLETSSIPKIVNFIEKSWHKPQQEIINDIYQKFEKKTTSFQKMDLPKITRQITEGFIKVNEFEYALNLYSCKRLWQAKFLEDLSILLTKYNMHRIYITSRKSLLIKHIPKETLYEWQALLSFHSMTIRHSENELLWEFSSENKQLQKLQKKLIDGLEKKQKSISNIFISLQKINNNFSDSHLQITIAKRLLRQNYQITYHKNFDPYNSQYHILKNLSFKDLLDKIINLSQEYIHIQKHQKNKIIKGEKKIIHKLDIYECPNCFNRYDQNFEKILFQNLRQTWRCQLCDTPKEAYKKMIF